MAEEGLSDKIADKILERLETKETKPKKFNLPFGVRIGSKGKIKRNYVLTLVWRRNGSFDFKFLQINDDMIYLNKNDTYHLTTSDYIGYYKNFPMVILPEWSLEPMKKEEFIEGREKNDALTEKIIINLMKMGVLKPKMQISGKTWFFIIIGIIVVAYLFYTSTTGAPPA